MIVVSDTSCITNLLSVGQIDLLAKLFGEVLIPPAVESELRKFHSALPAFLKVSAPTDRVCLARLQLQLDPGEAEAICLAIELGADRLLIDERVGRKVALREGVAIIGLVGVLVTAKRRNLIATIGEVLDQLEKQAGFRLGDSVKRTALRQVDE